MLSGQMDNSSLFEVENEAPSSAARGSGHDEVPRMPADGDQGLLLTTETEAPAQQVTALPSAGADGGAEVLDIQGDRPSGDDGWTGDDTPDVPAVAYEERTPGPA